VIRARPVLSNGVAGAILTRSETQGVESRLRDAERWLAAAARDGGSGDPVPEMVVADEEAYRRLPGTVAIHRAGLARLLGDVDGTISHARRALSLFDADDDLGQASASILLALAYWTNADLEAAIGVYADAMPRFERAGYLSDVVSLAIALADMRIAQGRLHDAMRAYERGLELATGKENGALLRGAADMHVGISEILRERNDLAGAAEHLQRSAELGEENGLPQHPYRSRVAIALLRHAEGNHTGAIELLVDAERRYVTDFLPPVRPVAAVKARLLIAQGDLSAAWTWAREHAVSAEDEPTYVREFEHVTLARLMLAQAKRDRTKDEFTSVLRFLDRLRDAAETGGRSGALIDLLVVQALAHEAAGDRASALASLRHAIELGDPEGYVRIFTDEGPAMAALLKLAARQPSASDGAARLLAATSTTDATSPVTQSLIEPLSERELEVLRLLQGDLDGPDIARELSVSLATVRSHTRNVYAKLGVNNRRSAVRRGADLGLFAGSGKHPPTS
jgi:LuxR family maltose regulon positive regulatory protein